MDVDVDVVVAAACMQQSSAVSTLLSLDSNFTSDGRYKTKSKKTLVVHEVIFMQNSFQKELAGKRIHTPCYTSSWSQRRCVCETLRNIGRREGFTPRYTSEKAE